MSDTPCIIDVQSLVVLRELETNILKYLIAVEKMSNVIPVAEFGIGVLKTLLDSLGSIKRKIAIGIGNKTQYAWQAVGVYFRSGTSDDVLPACASPQEAVIYPARKTSGPVATGVVGVLCYYIPDRKVSLCILFSVPFDYNLYSNWWDVQVFSGKKSPDNQLYNDMYYGKPYKGDDR